MVTEVGKLEIHKAFSILTYLKKDDFSVNMSGEMILVRYPKLTQYSWVLEKEKTGGYKTSSFPDGIRLVTAIRKYKDFSSAAKDLERWLKLAESNAKAAIDLLISERRRDIILERVDKYLVNDITPETYYDLEEIEAMCNKLNQVRNELAALIERSDAFEKTATQAIDELYSQIEELKRELEYKTKKDWKKEYLIFFFTLLADEKNRATLGAGLEAAQKLMN